MASLVEDIVSLEKEADSIVAQARAEAKEMEKSTRVEAEDYRQKRAEEVDRKVLAFQSEMEEKQKHSIAEMEKDLSLGLDALDHTPGAAIDRQIQRIVNRFGEL